MKTLFLTYDEFNAIIKVLAQSGHDKEAFDLIHQSVNNESTVYIQAIEDDVCELVKKLLVINDDKLANELIEKL